MSRILFGERSPEISQADAEACVESWLTQVNDSHLASVAPHPTDSDFVLRWRTVAGLGNGAGENTRDLLALSEVHHQKLAEFGAAVVEYEHAVCQETIFRRPVLFTAARRIVHEKPSESQEYEAKEVLRGAYVRYFDWTARTNSSHFLYDSASPNQAMFGTQIGDTTAAAQHIDIEPRMANFYGPQHTTYLSERRLCSLPENWHNVSLAQPRFDAQGAFIAQ